MIFDIVKNRFFYPVLITCILTQLIKIFVEFFKAGKINIKYLWSTGGMPSSHSSVVCSLLTRLALDNTDSRLFAVCLVFSLIVMYDAAHIRRSAGDHAALLNKINKNIKLRDNIKMNEVDLKEVLGHTPLEVIVGAIIGITNSIFVTRFLNL